MGRNLLSCFRRIVSSGIDWFKEKIMVTKKQILIDKRKAMVQSYLRSCLAAVLAVASTGNYALEDLGKALVAAALPPLMRWANPNDKAFGRTE